ncbi:MAG: hypothetical protein CMB26_01530 [Euryarchaeota archaeon]|mgnify:FL=1|nr:hypothetical protein [Euryarchaeota archaeon]|tara:strand:- start:262 stop:528 length:267 start_codon:yes stop_codon:yes gene_type:complete
MQSSSNPDIASNSTVRRNKKAANFLLVLGPSIILLKFVIATQIFFDLFETSISEEAFNLIWYNYMNSVADGFFQGSVIIGLGLIYNRM